MNIARFPAAQFFPAAVWLISIASAARAQDTHHRGRTRAPAISRIIGDRAILSYDTNETETIFGQKICRKSGCPDRPPE
jgi:hypothetical protein